MVYIELNGRLGNHLFQIATGATIAAKNGTELFAVCHEDYFLPGPKNLYIREYIKQFENNIYRNVSILDSYPTYASYYIEPDYTYSPIEYVPNILLKGSFQSYKYFDSDVVNSLFKISPTIEEYIKNKYGFLLQEGITSIHVRRGDYCKIPHQYPVCSEFYFKKAIEYIGAKKTYLVLSDDIGWCKSKFIGENFHFVENENSVVDLYLQTMCTNNIISNSTFSWWGAWLNPSKKKIVICPTPWYGKSSYTNLNVSDLIPTEWVQIKNRLSIKMTILSFVLLTKEKLLPSWIWLKKTLAKK